LSYPTPGSRDLQAEKQECDAHPPAWLTHLTLEDDLPLPLGGQQRRAHRRAAARSDRARRECGQGRHIDGLQVAQQRAKACSKASWSFQVVKSGMKYCHTSSARLPPMRESGHSQSCKASKSTRQMGNSLHRRTTIVRRPGLERRRAVARAIRQLSQPRSYGTAPSRGSPPSSSV
jgi:hypothetical protein